MAKKRRPAPQAARRTAATQNDKKAESRRAIDGFINTLAYLGEASDLNKANDYERHSITNDYELLTVLYRENWLAKRIIDTPCEDMTRAWYTISSELEQDKLDELAKLEAKHNIKQEVTNMLRWARLYGGAAAVMVIKGQEDMLDQPLDFDMLGPGCFRGLIVVDRVRGLYPSLELEDDMDDPEFGYPRYYNVILDDTSGETLQIHHSRLLMARGRMLPIQEEINEEYWGASEIEHVYEELQKRNATSANIAQLVFQANVSAMRIGNFGEALAMGTEEQKRKVIESIYNVNRIKNSFGLLLMGNEDSYEQHPYSFAGIAEVYESFMMDMAGAAEIPATKLFGRSPQGMNATGESDMKNYYEMLAQLQERNLRPAMEKLLPVMAMSLWGMIPEDMEIVFEPLMTTTPDQRADIMSKQAGAIIQAFSAGLISQKTALLELQEQGKSIGAWTNITDEDIENAEDQVDSGEEMQDPMGMMGPGAPGAGGTPAGPGAAPEGPGAPPKGPGTPPQAPGTLPEGEQPEQDSSDVDMEKVHELKERIHRILEEGNEEQDSSSHQDARRERLVRKVKRQILRAASGGDLEKAREILKEYQRIKSDEPDCATEIQDEPPKPKKAKRGGFLNDLIGSLRRLVSRDDWNEGDHPRGQPGNAGQFAPKGGGTSGSSKNEENSSSGTVANSPQAGYNTGRSKSVAGWKGLNAAVEVSGPKASRKWMEGYFKEHPEVEKESAKYMDVRSKVDNFLKDHPNAENYKTYDTKGNVKEVKDGYCVTFHQNNTETDPLGAYTDEDYAKMVAIAMHELGADEVNIGYYGNPEVSFVCKDEKTAKEFAVKHNQESVYNASTGRTLHNKKWDPNLNPIRL